MNKFVKIILVIILILILIILISNTNKNKSTKKKEVKMNDNKIKINNNEIEFGKYYNNDNKLEPIIWTVLDEKDGNKLLITKYIIDSIPYDKNNNAVWDSSDIRKWLNNGFYNTAFNSEEKGSIVLEENEEDKVFLLTHQEVSKYFKNEDERLAKPTNYAVKNGCYANENGDAAWWTRSPGLTETSPEYLASNGDFGTREHQASETIIGTRPAIWVKDV